MSQNEHTLKRFDNELETIRARILEMGGLVEIQLKQALLAVEESNSHLARQVVDQDQKVNQMEVDIDSLCCSVIACHKPTASDLRLILTATKIIVQLERIGDESKKIASIAERRAQNHRLAIPRFSKIRHSAELTQKMLQDVLDSIARFDPSSARSVRNQNTLVTEEYCVLLRNLIQFMSGNPSTISTSIETLFIAKAIERIGEHIRIISELVIDASNRYNEARPQPAYIAEV